MAHLKGSQSLSRDSGGGGGGAAAGRPRTTGMTARWESNSAGGTFSFLPSECKSAGTGNP